MGGGAAGWGCATRAADQACPSGHFARAVDEDGELGCATPTAGSGGGSTAFLAVERNPINRSDSIGILSNGQPFEMVRLELPPGIYTFAASGTVKQEEYHGPTFGDALEGCALSAAGNELQRTLFYRHELQRQVSLNSAARLPTGGVVSVTCHTRGDGYVGYGFRLVATSVGALG